MYMPAWKFFAAVILSNRSRGSDHELARKLDGVPFHAVYARDTEIIDPGEQVMESVPELVKERNDVVVREKRWLASDRSGEVAHEVGDRRLQGSPPATPRHRVVHPRTTPLRVARVQVEVELADQRTILVGDPEEPHVRMPGLGSVGLDTDAVQRLHDAKHAFQDLGLRKVLLHLALGIGVALLAQRFRSESDVPCRELGEAKLGCSELAQLGEIAPCERQRFFGQVVKEREDLAG